MESLRELYKIGVGPSSSHTMGPQRAALKVKETYPQATHFEVYLHGSLALTGKGHLTDYIIEETLGKDSVKIHFVNTALPKHPNGMIFEIYRENQLLDKITVYSVGGGALMYDDSSLQPSKQVYPHGNLTEILEYCDRKGINLYDYTIEYEDEHFKAYLFEVLNAMFACVEAGLSTTGVIPGKLGLKRVAKSMYQQAINTRRSGERDRLLVSSYAYAVSEENASGHRIVTAPTCGASGVLPAVLYYCYKQLEIPRKMGLEHNLGLTCDPVGGYVQIPCIERNGFGALRAMDAAMYAKQLGYLRKNKVSFDAVVRVMKETGKDLNSAYKETSLGGLAKEFGFENED